MRHLPAALVSLRFILGPVVFVLAGQGFPHWGIFLIVTAAGLSDLLDGILARRWGVASESLRVADSYVDVWYYVWVAMTVWRAVPEIVLAYQWPLLSILAMQLLAWLVDLLKYRRFATYHAYTAKAWGFGLYFATAALLVWGQAGPFMWLMVVLAWISLLEGIAITLILPRWTHDVPSVWHALRLRPEQLAAIASA